MIRDKSKRVYYDMVNRCYNKKAARYNYYGARGITVCKRWLVSYDNFLTDMGEKPEGKSLDRRNNDKGYSKRNCKWNDHSGQMRNCSSNQVVGQYSLAGKLITKFQSAKEAAEKTGTSYYSILHIINKTGVKGRKVANGFRWKSLKKRRRHKQNQPDISL